MYFRQVCQPFNEKEGHNIYFGGWKEILVVSTKSNGWPHGVSLRQAFIVYYCKLL
jgi:hypothetical protein